MTFWRHFEYTLPCKQEKIPFLIFFIKENDDDEEEWQAVDPSTEMRNKNALLGKASVLALVYCEFIISTLCPKPTEQTTATEKKSNIKFQTFNNESAWKQIFSGTLSFLWVDSMPKAMVR